ncbi:phage recombination protein Bet [Thorsellia kenyensis]|uniref:Phage recombination protein Bet n=1 Tax=Thorsellia kenyensis TaxID=1549888 RepID=A0ABV6C6J0_9GAMM
MPQAVIEMGFNENVWSAMKNSIYPGASDDSIVMALDYCRARELDPMLKPVHLVPMSVKDSKTGQNVWRDVVMPGIGMYRIQADRSGNYAGADEPIFGPDVTENLGGVEVTYPKYCKYTVRKKMPDNSIAEFSATEYWKENYAVQKRDSLAPNSMWRKRPYAQLAKCAEAQALRKAWPEIGQQPTAEEMEGEIHSMETVVTAKPTQTKSKNVDDILKGDVQDAQFTEVVEPEKSQSQEINLEEKLASFIEYISKIGKIPELDDIYKKTVAKYFANSQEHLDKATEAYQLQKADLQNAMQDDDIPV